MHITERTTVADIAAVLPSSVRVFQRHGVDFCCGGKKPIGVVCEEQGLSFAELSADIVASAAEPDARQQDWTRAPLRALIDHIVAAYHEPLREELSRLESMAARVAEVHGPHASYLERIHGVVRDCRPTSCCTCRKRSACSFPPSARSRTGAGRRCRSRRRHPERTDYGRGRDAQGHPEAEAPGADLLGVRQVLSGGRSRLRQRHHPYGAPVRAVRRRVARMGNGQARERQQRSARARTLQSVLRPCPSRSCCWTTGRFSPRCSRRRPSRRGNITAMPSTSPAAERQRWWRGSRGEWLVVAQLVLMALVFFGPRTVRDLSAFPLPAASRPVGMVLILAGGALLVWGIVRLGSRLTPLPYPKVGSTLVRSGPYAIVRHPMYCGGLGLAFGWALWVRGWLTLGYAGALFVLLDLKSRREERWLAEQFPAYPDYQKRVKRLIPFIY